jgi:hypothetical protein
MKFIEWLSNIDRRIIFLFIAAAVAIPILIPMGLPVKVSPQARGIYEEVEKLPDGSNVLLAFDYDPAAAPECHPMALAFLRHCFAKHHKVFIIALWPQGAQLAVSALEQVTREFDVKYGEDYINLGYKAGGMVVINSMGTSIPAVFPNDMEGRPISQFPIMTRVKSLKDFAIILDLSAGDPGIPAWVAVANSIYRRPVAGGCTAVSAPQFYPYLQTHQLVGLLGGLRGAAEYEVLIDRPDKGVRRMGSQSIAHLVIIIFIIFANISYVVLRRRERRQAAAGGVPGSPR